ncbi:MAG: AzlD domain-containing protein [Zhaonellaceae bacterium]|jgi:branched-subunit amino acid transport protein|nr:AzlD domain-containing protein [Clostridia bacterium]
MSGHLIAVLLMAVVTYIPRMLPMVLVKSKIKSNFIKSFLYYVPYAVLGAMIFPGILYSTGSIASAVVGLTVAVVLAFFNKKLLTVALGAILSVYLWETL